MATAPILFLTFLFGPLGLLAYLVVSRVLARFVARRGRDGATTARPVDAHMAATGVGT